jgi:hypothetical protein
MEIFYLQQNLFATISKKGDGAMIVTSLPLSHHLIILLPLNLCSIPPLLNIKMVLISNNVNM